MSTLTSSSFACTPSSSSWVRCRLGDIAQKANSGLAQGKLDLKDHGYPVYGASGLIGYTSTFHMQEPFIAIVKDGAGVGNLIFCPEKSSAIGTLDCLTAKEGCSTEFLGILLSLVSFSRFKSGSTIPHIYFRDYKDVFVTLPSPDEQRRICEAITSLDSKNHTLEAKKSALEDYKRSLMRKLFTREIRFANEDMREFDHWKSGILADVVEIAMGQSPSSDSYNEQGHGLPLIQGNADISNRKSLPRKFTTAPGKTCRKGDILITVRAPAGEVAMSQHDACLGRGVASVRPKSRQSRDFWYYALLHNEPRWDRLGQGAIFAAIGGDDLRNFPVMIPEMAEQNLIASALANLDQKIDSIAKQVINVEAFKKGLLQKFFMRDLK